IYDNRTKLDDRVARLKSGSVMAQDPRPRMRRVVSNVEIERSGDSEATVGSNFILVQARGEQQITWRGRSTHKLRRQERGSRIAHKQVLLVNSEQEMPVLQFLI